MKPALLIILTLVVTACQGGVSPSEVATHPDAPETSFSSIPEPSLNERLALPPTTSYSGVGG